MEISLYRQNGSTFRLVYRICRTKRYIKGLRIMLSRESWLCSGCGLKEWLNLQLYIGNQLLPLPEGVEDIEVNHEDAGFSTGALDFRRWWIYLYDGLRRWWRKVRSYCCEDHKKVFARAIRLFDRRRWRTSMMSGRDWMRTLERTHLPTAFLKTLMISDDYDIGAARRVWYEDMKNVSRNLERHDG